MLSLKLLTNHTFTNSYLCLLVAHEAWIEKKLFAYAFYQIFLIFQQAWTTTTRKPVGFSDCNGRNTDCICKYSVIHFWFTDLVLQAQFPLKEKPIRINILSFWHMKLSHHRKQYPKDVEIVWAPAFPSTAFLHFLLIQNPQGDSSHH